MLLQAHRGGGALDGVKFLHSFSVTRPFRSLGGAAGYPPIMLCAVAPHIIALWPGPGGSAAVFAALRTVGTDSVPHRQPLCPAL